jgi:hypothetical protein
MLNFEGFLDRCVDFIHDQSLLFEWDDQSIGQE